MAVVSLKIGERFYKFSCNDGQESHMRELAVGLDKKAEQLTKTLGFMQEGQLLAMMCLLLAEEMYQSRQSQTGSVVQDEQIAQALNNLAIKLSGLADTLQ